MRRCFREATLSGTSFGILDAHASKLPEKAMPPLPAVPQDQDALASLGERWNTELGRCSQEHLKQQIAGDDPSEALAIPGAGLAMMVLSGSRGGKQLRQILAGRGALLPGSCGFALDAEHCGHFLIPSSLLKGMTSEETFWAAMNARSSMVDKKLETPKAGHLTRRLVLALWGWKILREDCGSEAEPRGLLTCGCLADRGFCATCYGPVAGLESVPVGLLAAQSIGERGTQLSMQSFHTGSRAMSIALEVNPLLKGGFPDDASFIAAWHKIPPYQDLDVRYLQLLWLVINRTQGKTLDAAWKERRGPLSGLVGAGQIGHLLEAISASVDAPDNLPLTQVLLGQSLC